MQNTTKTRESRPKERSQSNGVLAQTLQAANQQKFRHKFHVENDSTNPRFLLACFRTRRGGRIYRFYIPGPPSQFKSITWLPNGAIELGISAETGRLYSLEISTDLMHWQRLTNIVAPGPHFVIQDTISQAGQRFYRLVE